MNAANDPVLDRIESAERMLRQARSEYLRGRAEDAQEFLRAAGRNVTAATQTMQGVAQVVELRAGRQAP